MAAVNTWENASLTSGPFTVTVSGASANNILIASLGANSGLSGSVPTGWTLIYDGGSTNTHAIAFYRIATGDSDDNFVYTPSAIDRIAVVVAEYSGNETASPISASSQQRDSWGGTQSGSSGSISPTDDGFLVATATASTGRLDGILTFESGFVFDLKL